MVQKNQEQDKKENEKNTSIPQKATQEKDKVELKGESKNSAGAKIVELQKQLDEMKDKYLRTYADMENIKRRGQIEIAQKSKTAIGDFALDVLPVADNLTRALETPIPEDLKQNEFIKNLTSGVQMTQKSLMEALQKNGVTPIDSVGKPFNPHNQKAIQQVVNDTVPEGTVIQEWQKGYKIGDDRILREAMVIVSKKQ